MNQENLEKRYAIVGSEATYADVCHAYAVLFGRPPEQVRYGCFFYVPEHRGRIITATPEAKEKAFEAIANVENLLAFPLRLRVSCVPEFGQPEVFAADAPGGEVTFASSSVACHVKSHPCAVLKQRDECEKFKLREYAVKLDLNKLMRENRSFPRLVQSLNKCRGCLCHRMTTGLSA